VFIASGDKLKGVISLLIGLLVATVGLDNPAGTSAFHLRSGPELMGGAELIPIMVGMFAVSEVMRSSIVRGCPAGDRPRPRSATSSGACGDF
jgi:putative tricarboxylic transport membrane protein